MSEKKARGRPRAFADKTEQNTIQSLDRAMAILETLAEMERSTLSELAAETAQSPATVYRVLVTLQGRGLVDLDTTDQSWAVGPKAFRIGSSFLRRTSVVDRARPLMRQLMVQSGETANLGVARGDTVLFLAQVETHASLRAFFPPGTLSPLHASGIGKALLAQFESDRLSDYFAAATLTRFTDRTITDPGALAADLAEIRTRGYAVDDEEKADGMRCVAAPVFDAVGEAVAGLSVSGPAARLAPGRIAETGALVAQAAADLSRGLGAP